MTSPEIRLEGQEPLKIDELRDIWIALSSGERLDGFKLLRKPEAEDFFLGLGGADMAELVHGLAPEERRS